MIPRLLFVSEKLPTAAVARLEKHLEGCRAVPLAPDTALSAPEAFHPDMILSCVDGDVICSDGYLAKSERMRAICAEFGVEIFTDTSERASDYPRNVAFNALVTDGFVMCKKSSASKVMLEKCGNRDIIDIKQGYAACSTLYCGGVAVTSDPSVATALSAFGVEVLKIKAGHIHLEPYDYGFIGGACTVIGDTVFTFGEVAYHPEGDAISAFLTEHGIKILPLFDGELYDFGSAVAVY